MMRQDGYAKPHNASRILVVLITTASVALLTGCDKDSSAGQGGSAAPTKTTVRKPQAYTIVNAADISQAPRSSASRNPRNWPPVEFEPARLNFGVVPPHTIGKGRAKVFNVGDQPLRILKSVTSCGCTSADNLSGQVIQPGGFIEFGTEMEMRSGLGPKKEKITLVFEGHERTQVIFFYEAEVARPVRVVPPFLTASNRTDSGGWTQIARGQVNVSSMDAKPFTILKAHGEVPQYVNFNPATDEPRNTYTLKWDIDQFAGGTIPWFWVLQTDHPDAPVVDVRIRHSSSAPQKVANRPWQPKDQRTLVDFIRNGEPFEIITKHEYVPNRTPQPQTAAADSLSKFLEVQLVSTQPKGQMLEYRVRITPRNAPPGMLYEKISVGSAGHMVELRIIGRVIE